MLDVHPPHEAAHSWRDILIHLATITVGLFIALSLEGCVEWQHHRHLVREARENIRTEIEDNQKELRSDIDHIHQEQADMKHNVEVLSALRNNLNERGLNVTLRLESASLQDASWSTARTTGALAFMGYPEVKRYAALYDQQALFTGESSRVGNVYAESFQIFARFDLDKKSDDPVKKADVNAALQKVLAVQGELLIYNAIAEELNRMYTKALAGQS